LAAWFSLTQTTDWRESNLFENTPSLGSLIAAQSPLIWIRKQDQKLLSLSLFNWFVLTKFYNSTPFLSVYIK
jgi:hypothetical protein